MNKYKFIELAENPSIVTSRDIGLLTELALNYPYSSVVHILLAKAVAGTENSQAQLADAALRTPDRRILQEVMEGRFQPQPSSPPQNFAEFNYVETSVVETEPEPEPVPFPSFEEEEDIHHEEQTVYSEFNSFTEEEGDNTTAQAEFTSEEELNTPVQENSIFDELQENLRKLREQRERFNTESTTEETSETTNAFFTENINSVPENIHESEDDSETKDHLQQILERKDVVEIQDPKRQNQLDIINSFLNKSESLVKKYKSMRDSLPEEQVDLTKESNSLTPTDLATETLAKIMIRQGKTEKAIDIYEKLSLKYPQKKAYFAACIEKLKNS